MVGDVASLFQGAAKSMLSQEHIQKIMFDAAESGTTQTREIGEWAVNEVRELLSA